MKRWLLLLTASTLLGGCVTTTYRQADGYYVGGSPYGNADTVIYRDGGYAYPYGYGYDPYYSGYLPGFGYVPPAYYSGVVYGGTVVIHRDYDRHYHRDYRPRPAPRSYPSQPRRVYRWDARRPPPPVSPVERRWPERSLSASPLRTWQGEPRPLPMQAPAPRIRSAGEPRPVRKAPPRRYPPHRRDREP